MAASMASTAGMSSMLQFMKFIGQLKRVPRTGWVYRNVQKPESVSDHMYRMAMMSLTITDPTVDKDRCAFLIVCNLQEYETQSSPEARLVKQFDLLEMILQAHEYEELEGTPGRLQEFFDSTNGRFHHPDVLQLVGSLNKERGCRMTDGTKDSGNSQAAGGVSSQPHTTSHTS
eukprot:superscaffoldBa00000323_g3805